MSVFFGAQTNRRRIRPPDTALGSGKLMPIPSFHLSLSRRFATGPCN